jgi:hypothetical protein
VENICDSRGADLATHAQQIRKSDADITGQADEVGFMVFATETTANSLAAEARVLAETIADAKNTGLGASLLSPNFTEFDRCLANFKAAAQGAFGYLVVFTRKARMTEGRPGFFWLQTEDMSHLCLASFRASCRCCGESGGSVASMASLVRQPPIAI